MKNKFKVYTNEKMKEKSLSEEKSYDLEIPHEDVVTGLFVTSPYFVECMLTQDYFYYPIDAEAEESLMAPILNQDVLHEFLDATEILRKKENIPAAALLHIAVENDDNDLEMEPFCAGLLQVEFSKFFHTVVAAMNQELALEEEFEEVFEGLFDELVENGYLDKVLMNLMEYLSEPEVLETILFSEE